MTNFSLCLRQSAARHPERVAIVDGADTLTYARFDESVDALARGLGNHGVGPASVVAVVSQNSGEFLQLYFAAMRVGAIFLPLNHRLSGVEVAYQLDLAQVDVLFVGEGSVELADAAIAAAAIRPRGLPLGRYASPSTWPDYDELLVETGHVPDVPRALGDPQRIMFTSGTTSHPKAALTTHGQIWMGALARATEFHFTERDVNLVNGPLYHASALDHFASTHFVVGGSVVVTRGFDPRNVLALLEQRAVTNTWLSPTMVRMVSEVPGWERVDVSALRVLLVGGERMPEHLLERLEAAWPQTGIHDCYGLTESSFATYADMGRAIGKRGSVGRSTIGTRVRVVSESGTPVRNGETGEVQISGLCVFPGYLADEAATAHALTDGWLRTGDLGRLDDDGYLFLVDRVKDMIRSGGENIASPEVERVLFEFPGVLDAAVVGVPDERWGEVPVAFVVADSVHGLSTEALIAHASERLGKFKVPKAVHFVKELPRTASGKVMKRVLRDTVTRYESVDDGKRRRESRREIGP
ncbi:AMP-binding protein [Nonomuraea lactucae]|uniref:AMP-binding protein n=1 Tax=Nonomuraea lactucae TaxID=2249762 RepID=UPI000DE2FAAD|nr:AMP-binding protein [Nonomuraea lactucae]